MSARGHILIVDDEPHNVELLAAILVKERYAISKAYSGRDAIAMASEEDPDVILLDLKMPDMDGYDVTQALKEAPKTGHIPIVLVTAIDGADDRAKGLNLGADEFLNKPVHRAELIARVQSFSKLRQSQKELQNQHNLSLASFTKIQSQDRVKTILLVEDDESLSVLFEQSLIQGGHKVLVAHTAAKAKEHFNKTSPDLILLDIRLPDANGLTLLKRWKTDTKTSGIPIIIITADDELGTKVTTIELGADDYLIKPIEPIELLARTKACLRRSDAYFYLQKELQRVQNEALTDSLTHVRNRLYFDTDLMYQFKLAARNKHAHFCLAMVDIDDFKVFNDTYGHLIGDSVLRLVAHILDQQARASDTVARYGGEEFCIILPDTDLHAAEIFAERFRKAVEVQTVAGINHHKVTISIGLASILDIDQRPEDVIFRADAALYHAKSNGKNQVSRIH